MGLEKNTRTEERIIVYILGIGASLIAPLLFIFSPLWAYVILKMYDKIKGLKKSTLKYILIVSIVWVVTTTIFAPPLSYLFNTTFASLLVGMCICRILEEKKLLSPAIAYIGSLIVAIFSSGFSVMYLNRVKYGFSIYYIFEEVILKKLSETWYNEYTLLSVLVSFPIGIYVAKKTNNYLLGYFVGFALLLTGFWLYILSGPIYPFQDSLVWY